MARKVYKDETQVDNRVSQIYAVYAWEDWDLKYIYSF